MRQDIRGGADAAIEALTRLKAQLEGFRSARDPAETRAAWLRTQAELNRLNPAARPFGLLSREIDVWIDRFGDEIARLQALKWFSDFHGQLVIPDTSAFIKGPYFADFDWHSLAGLAVPPGPVRLIVPILVIEELDALKEDRDERVRGRAQAVLDALWELHAASPAGPAALPGKQVTVQIFLDEPWHVRRPVSDDEIVERAQAIEAITGRAVLLAVGDYAMLYRAAASGLTAVLLPGHGEISAASGAAAGRA